LWVIAAGALALVAPLSGLVVFVATSVASNAIAPSLPAPSAETKR